MKVENLLQNADAVVNRLFSDMMAFAASGEPAADFSCIRVIQFEARLYTLCQLGFVEVPMLRQLESALTDAREAVASSRKEVA
jgi:hypothetical protein